MKKEVTQDQKVPLLLSGSQIQLIRDHVLIIEKYLENSINVSEVAGNKRKLMLSLYDLEDLVGHLAASANHCEDKKIQSQLDTLIDAVNKIQDKYTLKS